MSELRVRLIGGPTALLRLGGLRLLTDPTFDPPGEYPRPTGGVLTKLGGPAIDAEEVGAVDVVLLSHDQHADNLDHRGRAALGRASLVAATPEAAARLGGVARGLPPWTWTEVERRDGGGVLRVTAVPARHGPEGCEPVTGPVTGFVLSGEDLPTVYISGDNASLEVVQEIARRLGPVEVAVLFAGAARTTLFAGAPLTLTGALAVEAVRVLGVRHVVPVHLEGWSHFSEGPEVVRAAFAAASLSECLHLLAPGEEVTLGPEP
jgi:L-ascorbate metabolism protein UlaG (beta-lactamase superfamily)